MATLNIAKIVLDKDSWENIPPMVFKSFQATAANMNGIKKWADVYEGRAKSQSEFMTKYEDKLATLEHSLGALQERVETITQDMTAASELGRQQAMTCAGGFQRMERCMAAMFRHFSRIFGVKMDLLEHEDAEGAGKPAHPETEGADLPPGIAIMQASGTSLESELGSLELAFQKWEEMQAEDRHRHESVHSAIEELRSVSERSNERILSWRELLKESSHAIDSLGGALAQMQTAVQELHATRVQHHDVESAVRQKGEELESLHRLTEQSMDKLCRRVEDHVSEVQRLIVEISRQTDDRIEDHSNQVAKMVEGHMNPLNAYLNTMHVKTDVMRVDIDKLRDQAPRLVSKIEEIFTKLTEVDKEHKSKGSDLDSAIDGLSNQIAAHAQRHDEQHMDLSTVLQDMSDSVDMRISEIRTCAESTAESLDLVKREDLSGLARELLTLDQKVAKWVHATPLPAKISEARLYSLEARLADEMDARPAVSVSHVARNAVPALVCP
ncbi:unnamed protein product [Symbiodinium natans]|uniref:Uncharacterized protein n=1 Tax=Symbiodinium natans TaxID=878477 RepID=A0A812RPX6_9DINO|nr:unnamed protein product [Symbiodinium natans]